jgi:arginyl-tRNA--protein-N-Asp/Glu arginylyltransferase
LTDLQQLKFYATPEHSCSYLDDRQAKTIFADPEASLNKHDYSTLSDLGFRRSGNHIYRPHCQNCSACISARIPVELFRPSRSQKRVLKLNQDLQICIQAPAYSDEYYALYERYIRMRHSDGDMHPTSKTQFESFLVQSRYSTHFIEFRTDESLLGVAVVDYLEHGISAIYTFFDPEQQQRSLGKLAILKLIQLAQNEGLPYLYLGYWVQGCQKMAYKTDYHPIQLLIAGHWVHLPLGETSDLKLENILRRT